MKLMMLVVLLPLVAFCAADPIPTVPGDNDHYVEGVSRYIWFPDGDGVPHLVDLHAPAADDGGRSGANNAYWLHTRRNPNNHQLLVNGDINSVRNSNYQPNLPLKVVVHGWNSKGSSKMNPEITAAILAVMDANVIVVDWSKVASGLYTTSVRGVPDVGRHLGNFLIWLIGNAGGNWNNVHLIGFSLGAHVVGNAGRTCNGRIARITGLDPAGPQWGRNADALNRHDGIYVESIHTDGGLLGIFDPISDADFYPNGGRNRQPGCYESTCSHNRAPDLFASSVRTNHFIGMLCTSLDEAKRNRCTGAHHRMGNGDLNKRGSGLYGLSTGSRWPY